MIASPVDFWFAMQYMDEAIRGTFTEETKRFWRVWSQVKEALRRGKIVDRETAQRILGVNKANAYQWLNRLYKAGLIEKVEEPITGRRPKVYYVADGGKANKKTMDISMQKLFDKTQKWFTKHGVSVADVDNVAYSEKNIFYKKFLHVPFSGSLSTVSDVIDSLPDAPKDIYSEAEQGNYGRKKEEDARTLRLLMQKVV